MGREEGVYEVVRVRHMRIDFNLIPIQGHVTYCMGLEQQILGEVRNIIGKEKGKDDNLKLKIEICPGEYVSCFYPNTYELRCRKFSGDRLEKQLRDGDRGYIVIWDSFGFVDRLPGDDWEDKFRNARQSLINDLNCTFYGGGSQLLVTHLNPSQDARLFINLLSSSSLSTALQPTLVLKGLPPYLFSSESGLLDLVRSLTKTRELDEIRGKISIQFKNYKECYKALKKLCSHSFIKKEKYLAVYGVLQEKYLAVYDLTLKDDSLVSNVFDEVLGYKYNGYKAYSQSATTKALNNRVAMLEKEFNVVKDMTENSKVLKGSAGARALKYRGAMLEKRLDIVTSVMKGYNECESPSTQALRNRVSVLNIQLSTIKPVLEDASICRIQALETRVAMLEKELKTMKDAMMSKKRKMKDGINESAGGYDKSPTDEAVIKRCKRLTRD